MGTRIATIQRQMRELGRLRTGWTDYSGSKPRPVKSTTWVVTSHSEDYVAAAAEIWGGKVDKWKPLGAGAEQWRVITDAPSLDAVLPPGDPLSQAYEMWSRGGAQRRCDGMTEMLSDSPCICRAEYGPEFHADAPARSVCSVTTRLNVILPAMPDVGAWRVQTGSYYAANEMAAAVDVLRAGLGVEALVPVRLRIEPRTRVAGGKTKQFPVVALELRGVTAGQVLAGQLPAAVAPAGQAPAVEGGERPALGAAPDSGLARDWVAEARVAGSLDELRTLWAEAQAAGAPDEMAPALKARAAELRERAETEPAAPSPSAPAAQVPAGMTADDLWMACVSSAPDGWTTSDLLAAYSRSHGGQLADDASPEQLAGFLSDLRAGRVAAAPDAAGVAPAETVPDTPESVWRDLVDGSGPEWTEELLEAGFAQAHDGMLPTSATVAQLMAWGSGVLTGSTRPPAAAPRRVGPVEPAADDPAPANVPF